MNFLGAMGSLSAYFHFDLAFRFLKRMPEFNRRELVWRIFAEEQVDSACFRTDGFIWNTPMTLGIPLELFRSGGFQSKDVRALAAWIRRHGLLADGRDTLIDVGANIGTTTVLLARELACRVLAVEPEQTNLRFLRMNIEANGCGNQVTVAPYAVLREPGVIRLLKPKDDPGGFCVDRARARESVEALAIERSVEARADRLESIAQLHGVSADRVAAVWSDTQGCELEVMETGAAYWAAGAPFYTEIEPLSLRRQGAFDSIAACAARHFDHYLEALDLVRQGEAAPVHPIQQFPAFLKGLPADSTLDVLFLPPNCKRQREN